MNPATTFDYARWSGEMAALRADTLHVLDDDSLPSLRTLGAKLAADAATEGGRQPLQIVVVGQYNAGKSTLLAALTGRGDIRRGSDVCTGEVMAYDWQGVRLLDTPGIKAGRDDHDARAYAAIDRADLLMYVVSSELFDNLGGADFRRLAFDRGHAPRMLLVVNKMTLGHASPEVLRPGIEEVARPLHMTDFRTVFIDAKAWIEALEADEEDRDELRELSHLASLEDALNRFVCERGYAGRLAAPLQRLRGVLVDAHEQLSSDHPLESAGLELTQRQLKVVRQARQDLLDRARAAMAQGSDDLTRCGDELAEAMVPGKSEAELQALDTATRKRAAQRWNELMGTLAQYVEQDRAQLEKTLHMLESGTLAARLGYQQDAAAASAGPGSDGADVSPQGPGWGATATQTAGTVKRVADLVAGWSTGPGADGAAMLSASAARGSGLHKAVYSVGRFFGAEFKPWQAVRIARNVGNLARAFSVVAGLVAVVGQIAEDRAQDEQRRQLMEARHQAREIYRQVACETVEEAEQRLGQCLASMHDAVIDALEAQLALSDAARTSRTATLARLETLMCRADVLLAQLATPAALPSPGAAVAVGA